MADKESTINALSAEDQAAMQPETFANPMVKALLAGAASNAAVPGQMMTPNPYPPGSEEADWYEGQRYDKGIKWAPREAISLASGAMPAVQAGTAGIFGGKLALTADHRALAEAVKMAEKGQKLPGQIRQDTGWFRSPADHQWRFEIPDDKMKLNYFPEGEGTMAQSTMGNFVSHPDLYDAYPYLQKIKTQVTNQAKPVTGLGAYDPRLIESYAPNADVTKSVLAHELQHGVQNIEKFSFGSNPDYYQDLIGKGLEKRPDLMPQGGTFQQRKKELIDIFGQAFPFYKKTAGEVEARNVQNRLDWTPEQRDVIHPWNSQDTPFQDQIDYNPWGPTPIIRALKR